MVIDVSQLRLSGNHFFLSERPPSSSYKKDKDYNEHAMDSFLEMLKEREVKTIVVLLSNRSMMKKYRQSLVDIYKREGFKVIHYPIRDFETPEDLDSFHSLITKISSSLKEGNVLMHCGAGLGRTGLVAAGVAVYKGLKPNAAISIIRRVRRGSVETQQQENFVRDYYAFSQMKKSEQQ